MAPDAWLKNLPKSCVNAISKAFLSIDASSNPAKLTTNHNEFAQMAESDHEQTHSVLSTSTLNRGCVGKMQHFCLFLCQLFGDL